MLDEKSPEEPDHPYPEPDPGADLPDPTEDLGPETPTAPSPEAASGELLAGFWGTVLLANAALLGLALAPMFYLLAGDGRLAGASLVGGLAAAVLGYRRYRLLAASDVGEAENTGDGKTPDDFGDTENTGSEGTADPDPDEPRND